MTDDQRKKYEEAAIRFGDRYVFVAQQGAAKNGFLAGASHASQDAEERVKQAHNGAIDSISKLIREKSFSFTEEEIQKLKI